MTGDQFPQAVQMGEGEKGNRDLDARALARVIRAIIDDQETQRLQAEFFSKDRQHLTQEAHHVAQSRYFVSNG